MAVKKNAAVSMSCGKKDTRSFGVGMKVLKIVETKVFQAF